jgi:two-component system cell cycle response regulator
MVGRIPVTEQVVAEELVRVLVVHDDPVTRMLMARFVRNAVYDVQTSDGAQDVLGVIRDYSISIAMLQAGNKQSEGTSLCRLIRSAHLTRYVYVVLFSTENQKELIIEGLDAGADECLAFLVHEPELIARMRTGSRIIALERGLREVNARISRLMVTDALTQLFNRTHLDQRLPRTVREAGLSGTSLSLVMCDIDHFKRINDTYGHAGGDEALRQFAEVLRSSVPSNGWVARYGGEEFTIVLPDVDAVTATSIAERIKVSVEATSIKIGQEVVKITASFGVAGWKSPIDNNASAQILIAEADKCAYQSKNAGRNKVFFKTLG